MSIWWKINGEKYCQINCWIMLHGLCVVKNLKEEGSMRFRDIREGLEIMTWDEYKRIEGSKWMKIMRRKNLHALIIMGETRQRLGSHGDVSES